MNCAPARLFEIQILLAGADFRATHGSAKKRSKDAEVEQPGYEWHQTNDGYDDATYAAVHNQKAQGDEDNACHNTSDAASRGSHKLYEGIHFLSPILFELVYTPSIGA